MTGQTKPELRMKARLPHTSIVNLKHISSNKDDWLRYKKMYVHLFLNCYLSLEDSANADN